MSLRRLLAPLLLLPFLHGLHARTLAPAAGAPHAEPDQIRVATVPVVGEALPGIGAAAEGTGTVSGGRGPARGPRQGRDGGTASEPADQATRCRIIACSFARLSFAPLVERALTSSPQTYCNPPPVSLS